MWICNSCFYIKKKRSNFFLQFFMPFFLGCLLYSILTFHPFRLIFSVNFNFNQISSIWQNKILFFSSFLRTYVKFLFLVQFPKYYYFYSILLHTFYFFNLLILFTAARLSKEMGSFLLSLDRVSVLIILRKRRWHYKIPTLLLQKYVTKKWHHLYENITILLRKFYVFTNIM